VAVAAIATLPGAPLALPDLTPSLTSPPPELSRLRDAVGTVVARLDGQPCAVVCPSETAGAWLAGDLGLGGFGTGDPSRGWRAGDVGRRIAGSLEVSIHKDDIPTEGRVVARLLGHDVVTLILGLPVDSPESARAFASAAADEGIALVAVGDLSASVGVDSPRPGHDPGLDGLMVDGAVDRAVLGRLLAGPDAPVAAALQVVFADELPTLHGSVHVVRGVAALVASGN
jgi:hypothetical protein